MKLLVWQVLLVPTHAVLAWLYLALRLGVTRQDWRIFDVTVICVAVVAWLLTPLVTRALSDAPPEAIWPLLVATAVGFLVFSAVLGVGWCLRTWRGRGSTAPGSG